MVKLQYLGRQGIVIPRLKSKGNSAFNLPMKDFRTGKPLATQTFEVSEKEADELMRCWVGLFKIVVPEPVKKAKVVKDINIEENKNKEVIE